MRFLYRRIIFYLIALWAIVTGVLEFAAGIEFTGKLKSAWMLWAGGLLSVAFGVVIGLWPVSGALTIVWLIGIYAIVLGVSRVAFGYRMHRSNEALRSLARSFEQPAPVSTR